MNTQKVVNFLVELSANASSYKLPEAALSQYKGDNLVIVKSTTGELLNYGFASKLSLSRYNPAQIKVTVIGVLHAQGIILDEPLVELLTAQDVSPNVLVDFTESTKLQLINMANLRLSTKAQTNDSSKQDNPQGLPPEFTELLSTIFGPEFAETIGGEECSGCPGCCSEDMPDVNWDEPLFNGVTEVQYKRKEADEENGYRTVKMTYDGVTMKYPVDTKTGMPIFDGMDPNVYAVDNESLDDDSDQDIDDEQGQSLTDFLVSAHPEKAAEIKALFEKINS